MPCISVQRTKYLYAYNKNAPGSSIRVPGDVPYFLYVLPLNTPNHHFQWYKFWPCSYFYHSNRKKTFSNGKIFSLTFLFTISFPQMHFLDGKKLSTNSFTKTPHTLDTLFRSLSDDFLPLKYQKTTFQWYFFEPLPKSYHRKM